MAYESGHLKKCHWFSVGVQPGTFPLPSLASHQELR